MDEKTWNESSDPQAMLEYLGGPGRPSRRKAILFATACCRHIFDLLEEKAQSRKTIEFVERFADGLHTEKEFRGRAWGKPGGAWAIALHDAWAAASTAAQFAAGRAAHVSSSMNSEVALRWKAAFDKSWEEGAYPREALDAADTGVVDARDWLAARNAVRKQEEQVQSSFLRDIFGPLPFREVRMDPRWGTDTVRRLAEAAYEHRQLPQGTLEPERLAVLADALEEAGCSSPDLLGHLREPGAVHVRGCFCLDLLLKKT